MLKHYILTPLLPVNRTSEIEHHSVMGGKNNIWSCSVFSGNQTNGEIEMRHHKMWIDLLAKTVPLIFRRSRVRF